jgi:DNA-binding transcriptional ArsR family regulator
METAPSATAHIRAVPLKVWKQILEPVRAEIIEAMRALGPATIKEVASVLSRVPSSLYAHFRRLVELGILAEGGVRKLTRHTERVYELTAHDFVPEFAGATPRAVGSVATVTAMGVTKSAVRTLHTAARAGLLRVGPPDPNHGIVHEIVWLTGEELAELRAAMKRLKQLASTRKSPGGRRAHLLVAMYMPLAGSPRSKGSTVNSTKPARAGSATRPPRSK